MQKIITATGKEFNVGWCGQSTIDFALRFEVVGKTMEEIFPVFTDKKETEKLTHFFDEKQTEYLGFTKFKGVDLKPGDSVVVSLMTEN